MEILVLLQFYERVMPLFNSLYTLQHYRKPWFSVHKLPETQGFVIFALLVSCKVCKKQGH